MMKPENRLLLQGFEWHTISTPPPPHETHSPSSHYARLTRLLPSLAHLGVTSLWLPPGCKANNPQGNGYDAYDLWDLGEFDQKGARSTKWGSREELDDLLAKARECGVEMIWDAVLNHKAGADGTEECWAVEVDEQDRRYEICPPKKIEAWLRYEFHGRETDKGLKYSSFQWRPEHFNGVDWDQKTQKKEIYKLIDEPSTTNRVYQPPKRPAWSRLRSSGSCWKSLPKRSGSSMSRADNSPPRRPGKGWAEDVDKEHGNNDYLMFSNIDFTHKEVREDVTNWGHWMVEDVGIDGIRLDAVQHFSFPFTRDWIRKVQETSMAKRNKDIFVVGEVWTGDRDRITNWLDAVQTDSGPQIYAYDSPLLYNFSRVSEAAAKRKADIRGILRDTLLEARPSAAVTLVTNHDTQAGQASAAPMSRRLKPLFYAFILLRREGLPCVFWGDLFGTNGPLTERPISAISFRPSLLAELMLCRRLFAYGEQVDYTGGSKDCIAWTRAGRPDRPDGCAVVVSAGNDPKKVCGVEMAVGGRAGEVWVAVLRNCDKEVVVDGEGKGRFWCVSGDVCVWVRKAAQKRRKFPVKIDIDAAK